MGHIREECDEAEARRLPWDSEHFGFVVGRIFHPNIDDSELAKCLQRARANNFTLVYWSTQDGRSPSAPLLREYRGTLVERRVTYVATLGEITKGNSASAGSCFRVEEYPRGCASDELKSLALAAGRYSRFAIDGRFPAETFKWLYETWIERSTRREIADTVLTALDAENRLVGFVTIAATREGCQIGLIATAKTHRRIGLGRFLMRTAHGWMARHGAHLAIVVTQANNTPACRLYEHCGYQICEVENSFHFWLGEPDRTR